MRLTAVLPLVLVAALAVGCGDDAANEASSDTATGDPDAGVSDELQVEEVASGLLTPWGLAALDDGGLLIGSRDSAEILLLPAGSAPGAAPQVVGSVDGVRVQGESGLLGLALTDDESMLYAYRTGSSENGVVAMSWDGTTLGEPEEVVSGIPGGASFHQGGALMIGPDELLYIGTGDNGVPPDSADPESLSGKVLRYTLDGEPSGSSGSDSPVLSLGHRNVEGLVMDEEDRLWAAEFGQDRFDELNLIEAGSDYGWPEVEGTGGGEDYVDPAAVWSTNDASPSGIAWWDGSLWLAALRGERLWEVEPTIEAAGDAAGVDQDARRVADPVAHLSGRYGRIRNAVSSADGSVLWVVTSNTDGRGEPDSDDDRLLSITR